VTEPNGGDESVELSEETQSAVDEALSHAEDLLAGARELKAYPHLAYHLGILSLEEVGRSTLLVMRELAARRGDGRRLERESEDHVRKLFWALWGPSFGREVISGPQIEEFQGLAREVHETRKRGIYFDPASAPPREAISADEAENMLKLVEARLGMARNVKWAPPGKERAADIGWFMDTTADSEARTQIMSGASMKKLAELGSVPEWVSWLRNEFETAEREAIELAERELAREAPAEDEELEPKWRVKLRLFSGSHSIRPQPLTWWNDISHWIKFHPVGSDHRQLIVEMTLPKRVSAPAIWDAGFSLSKHLLLALNIGSSGFFWWYLPEHISRFYEQLTDVESNERLIVERSPRLRIDWGNNALSQSVLTRVAMCIHALPRGDEPERHEPFDHYLTGLGFLSKTDIFMQFEANAFEHFYLALKHAMRVYGDWDEGTPFPERFEAFAVEFFTEDTDRETYVGAAEKIEAGAVTELRVDLSEVAAMKVLTDAHLLRTFDRTAREEGSEANGAKRDSDGDGDGDSRR
jgi:AbiV family abortive infection protein